VRNIFLLLLGILFLFLTASCSEDCGEDDPIIVPQDIITGRVLYAYAAGGAVGAVVYLVTPPFYTFVDSTHTGEGGWYQFENVLPGQYCLNAAAYDEQNDQVWSHVSPMTDSMDFTGSTILTPGNLLLYEVFNETMITGQVADRNSGAPVDSAEVMLYKFAGSQFVICSGTVTDSLGVYVFTDVETGNYYVFARCVTPFSSPDDPSYWEAETDLFYCDGLESYVAEIIRLGEIPVRKPAIYIYPDHDAYFDVELFPNNGVVLTNSVPEYGTGWHVFVETSGRIDHQYDYLFYEAALGKLPELADGWCLSRDDLSSELNVLLSGIGLNAREAGDFIAYWTHYLTEYEYYQIYPLFDHSLDHLVGLQVAPAPDAILRVWFFFEGCDECSDLPPPELPEFQRGTITVIEWGGAMLN
jgi:hypothetical protein